MSSVYAFPNGCSPQAYLRRASTQCEAVHADLTTVESGGTVTFGLVDGQDNYEGTEANGVTSLPYGSYDASFVFIP